MENGGREQAGGQTCYGVTSTAAPNGTSPLQIYPPRALFVLPRPQAFRWCIASVVQAEHGRRSGTSNASRFPTTDALNIRCGSETVPTGALPQSPLDQAGETGTLACKRSTVW